MKLILILCLSSFVCFGQSKADSIDLVKGKQDVKLIHSLYIQGLKQIRHDAIIKWKFRYVHQIKIELKKEERQ